MDQKKQIILQNLQADYETNPTNFNYKWTRLEDLERYLNVLL